MRWVAITKKSGKEIMRDKGALFFSLLFPAIFILIFGFAFGSFTGGNTTYNIAIINLDEGIVLNDTSINHGDNFANILTSMSYLDSNGGNTTHIFDIREGLSEKEAQELVEEQDLVAYIIIPRNFSQAVLAENARYVQHAISDSFEKIYSDQYTGNGTNASKMMEQFMADMTENGNGNTGFMLSANVNVTTNVIIQGDPGSSSYFSVSGIIRGSLEAYVDNSGKIALAMSTQSFPVEIDPGSQEPYVIMEDRALEVSDLSTFDYQVPGIIVFALLMTTTSVCISLSREESKGTLTRLKLTKMNSFDMLFGNTIPYTVIAVVQLLILLGVALFMGYQFHPDANIFLALFIAIWGCLATVALGLILSAMAKNEDQAGYLGPMVAVPLSFLTGAFFSLPTITFTENFLGTGKAFELFDWLPWTQCSKALTKTMTYGASFGDVLVEIVIMIILTAVLFTLGVVLYHRKRLRAI